MQYCLHSCTHGITGPMVLVLAHLKGQYRHDQQDMDMLVLGHNEVTGNYSPHGKVVLP